MSSKSGLSPAGSGSSLDLTLPRSSILVKYVGGKYLTWFSVNVIICSLALLGLSIYYLVLYFRVCDNQLIQYLGSSSLQMHQNPVSSFLDSSLVALNALNSGASASTAFLIQPAIISLTVVSNLTTGTYFVYKNDSGSVVTTSNSADCSASAAYTCDTTYSNISTTYLVEACLNSSSEFSFLGPQTGSVDLVWAVAVGSSFSVSIMNLNLSYLSFLQDHFLDNQGGQRRVWLVNNETTEVLAAYGLSILDYNNSYSTSSLTEIAKLLPDGEWISRMSFSNVFESIVIDGLPGNVAALLAPIPNTPFVLLVGSTSTEFINSTITILIISMIVVSAIPLVVTSFVACAYLLRLVALRRRKDKRRREVEEARRALRAIKESKLRSVIKQ